MARSASAPAPTAGAFGPSSEAGGWTASQIDAIGARLCTTEGTCPVMGTASTMACLAETMGMTLPGTAAIPAVHADRLRAAEASGTRAVGLAAEALRPSAIVTRAAVDNALRVLLAIGGSTNGVLHLAAIAGRAGIDLSLDKLNRISDETPVLVDLKPTGPHYMEDLFAAGGLGPVLRGLQPLLDLDTLAVTGGTLGDRLTTETKTPDLGIVKSLKKPLQPKGGLIALFGSLAPGGAILKRSAADSRLFEHEGRAVVFESLDDLARRIDDPDLDVAPDDILVLQNAGPKSGTGMPEAGYLPIPGKLAKAGVKDMIRISDARMSGTAFGTIILHTPPKPPRAGRWGSFGAATASGSASSASASIFWWTSRNSTPAVDRIDRRQRRRAAMRACITTMFCRRMKAAISIFCRRSEWTLESLEDGQVAASPPPGRTASVGPADQALLTSRCLMRSRPGVAAKIRTSRMIHPKCL